MRVLPLLACLIAFAHSAVAKDGCMAMKEFHDQGGKLIGVKSSDPMQVVPPVILLDCGKTQCVAMIVVEGVVDTDGSLRDLKVTENTYSDQQDARAAALLQWKEKSRYQPPILNGKPVCIHQVWRHKFGTMDPS